MVGMEPERGVNVALDDAGAIEFAARQLTNSARFTGQISSLIWYYVDIVMYSM